MSVRSIAEAWNQFFFEPIAPTSIALYRILFGLLVIIDLILLWPDWLTWYGEHAFLSMETLRQVAAGTRLNLLASLPQDDWWILAFYWVFMLFAISLTVGFHTRLSSIAVFLCLTSIHQRNIYILNSGDTLLRVTGFFLMFAPAGAALSVDRLLRIWRGEGMAIQAEPPWAQRMIQIETAVAYLSTFYWKMLGRTWVDGTALHYVFRLQDLRRFPPPPIESALLLKLGTWMALVIEFACGVLIWFKETRYIVLLLGVSLHAGIEYTMNIPLFQSIILATYVTFIPPEDLRRFWSRVSARLRSRFPGSATVIYDGANASCERAANVLRAIDILGRLRIVDASSGTDMETQTGVSAAQTRDRVVVITDSGTAVGMAALIPLAPFLPVLWPLAPASLFARYSKQAFRAAEAAK